MKKTYIIPEILFETISEETEMLAGSPLNKIQGGGDDVTPPDGTIGDGEVVEGDGEDQAAKIIDRIMNRRW